MTCSVYWPPPTYEVDELSFPLASVSQVQEASWFAVDSAAPPVVSYSAILRPSLS